MTDQVYKGRIIKALAGFYYVRRDTDGEIYACRAKGIFRKRSFVPLVGDIAEFIVTHEGDKEGNIEKLFPRGTVLFRPSVANVDLGLIVFALKDPAPGPLLLDRMIVALEQAGLNIVIALNKTDLSEEEEALSLGGAYEKIGYRVIYTCAKEAEGKEELLNALKGHLAAVAGPSGAGKSSLINLLSNSDRMEVGDVSEKIRRGRQTTRHVELIELCEDTYIADTPGFSSLAFSDMEKEDLGDYFPEIRKHRGECRYAKCSHIFEPLKDCRILQELGEGNITPWRYESYRRFYEELSESEKY